MNSSNHGLKKALKKGIKIYNEHRKAELSTTTSTDHLFKIKNYAWWEGDFHFGLFIKYRTFF